MESRKRVLRVLSIIVALCMLFTACSSKPAAEKPKDASTKAAAEVEKQPFKITILAAFTNSTEPPKTKGDPVFDLMEKETNVSLDITWAPQANYIEKYSTVVASRNIPMVTGIIAPMFSNANFYNYAGSGMYWDLTDYIKKDAKLSKIVSTSSLEASKIDGKNYGIPNSVEAARVGLVYRKDWVDANNLKVPATLDELYQFAKFMTLNDPDKNGKNDTVGFAYVDDGEKEVTFSGLNTLVVAAGGPNLWGLDKSGKVIPNFMHPAYMEVLKLFKKMYDEKIMNQDFAVIKGNSKFDTINSGKGGMMMTSATNMPNPGGSFTNLYKVEPNAKLDYSMLFKNPEGKMVTNNALGTTQNMAITKTTVKEEKDMVRILKFFGDAMSGPSLKARTIGIEGIHYTMKDGKFDRTEDQKKLAPPTYQDFMPMLILAQDYGQPKDLKQMIKEKALTNEDKVVNNIMLGRLGIEQIDIYNEQMPKISDARVKFIMGSIDETGFQKAIDAWKAAGGQKLLDQANQIYSKSK